MKKAHNISIIFLLIVTTIFTNCRPKGRIVLNEFDGEKWQLDSLGCQGYRKNHYKKIYNYQKILLGETEESMLLLLGRPNSLMEKERSKVYSYFIHEGNQCIKKNYTSNDVVNNARLRISFDELHQVSDVNVIVP